MIRRLRGYAGMAAALAAPAFAQQASPPVLQADGAESVQIFEPAYFARYNPTSVLEMVNQVPGFSVQEGESVRGFGGAAGNVLINGERPSTKTGLAPLLGRTSPGNVVRIELITGQSATLDMRGQTKVVNVIMKEEAAAQPISWDLLVRATPDGRIQHQGMLSTQRSLFGGQINLSGVHTTQGNNGPGGGGFVNGGRHRYDALGRSYEYATGYTQQQPDALVGNFEFERPFGWGALRLNGSANLIEFDSARYFEIYTPDPTGPLTGLETNRGHVEEQRYTLGGDIERKFGPTSAKLITYHTRNFLNNSSNFTTWTGAGGLILSTTARPEQENGESIVRGQLNWKLSDSHAIEVAAEGAYNFIDNITGLTLASPAGVTSRFIDGSDTKVEEFRSEFQISDVWTVNQNLTIEPGFKFEMSRIEQAVNYQTRPDLFAEREFEYPKPSVTATWRINPERQLRLSYRREVAQLSFADFVSSLELVNNQTTGGNPDLVPERTWAFTAEFEQRFWKGGVLTLFGNYDEVEDVQDYVPLQTTAGTVDAPGNIGDGTRWSVGFRAAVPLEKLGLKGARLDASLNAGGSEVIDPVTGQVREFSDEFKESWTINFRHDLPEHKFAYGFRLNDAGPGTAYRFNELSRRDRHDKDFGIWVETTRWFGVRIRAGFDDLFAADYARTRVIYSPGDRRTGALNRIEQSHSSNGAQPYVRIVGKF